MQEFISVDAYKFGAAVVGAIDWPEVFATETFKEQVLDIVDVQEISTFDEERIRRIARDVVIDTIPQEVNDDYVRNALGLGRYSNLITDDDISDAVNDALDYDDLAYAVEKRLDNDDITYNVVSSETFERAVDERVDIALKEQRPAANTGTPAYVFAVRLLLTTITEEVLDALMSVNELVNDLPLGLTVDTDASTDA